MDTSDVGGRQQGGAVVAGRHPFRFFVESQRSVQHLPYGERPGNSSETNYKRQLGFCNRLVSRWEAPGDQRSNSHNRIGHLARFAGSKHPVEAVCGDPAQENAAVFSPDGLWVAYDSDASGQPEVYVLSADGRGRKWMVSNDGGGEPHWSSNGKELFYSKGEEIMSVDVKTSPQFEAGKPRLLFKGLFTLCNVTRDG